MLTPLQRREINDLFAHWHPTDPGGTYALIHNGVIIHQQTTGLANLEHAVPITATTKFPICSVTKTFTGAAIALLAHQGRLNLDAPARNLLPELPNHPGLTLRHLVTNTSGLRDSMESMILRGIWYRYPRSTQDLLDLACAQTTLSFPTGTRFGYCNTNFNLLAVVIERITGKSYAEHLAETFLTPLGMTNTLLRETTTLPVPNCADGYIPTPPSWEKATWSLGLSGSGSLVSTIADLARWHAMFRAGGLHGAPIVALMSQPPTLTNGTPTHYGFGLSRRQHRGQTVLSHGGGMPGYRAMFAHIPNRDLGFIALTNRSDGDLATTLRGIIDIIEGAPPAPPPPRRPPADGAYLDPLSGEVATITTTPTAIRLTKLDLALTLRETEPGTFIDDWGNYRSALTVSNTGFHLEIGGQAGSYAPLAPFTPPTLAEPVGRYSNADMQTTAELFLAGPTLTLRLGPAFHADAELALIPIAPDIFAARHPPPWTTQNFAVRLARENGAIARMLISSDLTKDSVFIREK